MMRPRKVKIHFNRINMQRGNPNVWTVHTSNACYQVERVVMSAQLETIFRPDGPQPRAYFSGFARIEVIGNTAYVT